ncbi:ComF family protein [Lacticaseibacillus mingshuiensis]|nr:ComF family protein [Lacticaseibacillus mingshuiensis]
MKAFIQSYKGNGDYRLHSAFADLLAGQFSKNAVLVPLTSEPSHLRARGFDPVLGLFGRLRLARWLTKGDTDLPQAQKDRRGRLQTAQSFSATLPRGHARIRHVILLDDLYTTGRTLYHARNALRDAGYQGQITSFSLIR